MPSSHSSQNEPSLCVAVLTVQLYMPWVHSLKEKRMAFTGLLKKLQQRFNVSAAEIGFQDTHQTCALGVAVLAANPAQADSILDHALAFIEGGTQAEVTVISREFR